MEFEKLLSLRRLLSEIQLRQAPSLAKYYDPPSGGFYHRLDQFEEGDFSKACTATCILALVASKKWAGGSWVGKARDLATAMLEAPWQSAGLDVDNPFTTAFMLEALTILAEVSGDVAELQKGYTNRLNAAEAILCDSISEGAAKIGDYPPSAYVTQLVVRTLRRRGVLTPILSRTVQRWAWGELDHQMSLRLSQSKSSDLLQMAYAMILASGLDEPGRATPDEHLILQTGLRELFVGQLTDGSWPRSQPLFHYPGVGSAHCYEYEMLVQLLSEPQLERKLLVHLDSLSKAAYALRQAVFELGEDSWAWSSGHHPQFHGPESWSTASVFHFAHALDRLIAEAVRRDLFDYLNCVYTAPGSARTTEEDFAPDLLDSQVRLDGEARSLKQTLYHGFVRPVADEAETVRNGGSLEPSTDMSAIFFGPPGTSKTELAKRIGEFLGWPTLTVNPSHFLTKGVDQILAEADRIFTMLASAERVVVLLDEFDEMVRERATAPEALSRLLTTAMLPMLTTINRVRRIVFIVATNHLEHFDFAISRPGRFDVILQIMPPTVDEKLSKWLELKHAIELLDQDAEVTRKLSALTYDECALLASRLDAVEDRPTARHLIAQAFDRATLRMRYPEDQQKTWADVCEEQQDRTRLRRLSSS